MNNSLITADRTTHLKILILSLLGSMFVMWVGISARSTATTGFSQDSQIEKSTSKLGAPRVVPRVDHSVVA